MQGNENFWQSATHFLVSFASTAFMQRNSFSPLAYLVHIIFTVLTFGYGRIIYVAALYLLDPA